MSKVKLAILDDYQGRAPEEFSHLSSRVDISSFPDTLNVTHEDQRAELIDRLKPFNVISTMRERTAFPPEVINSLPNLKLILTTGLANASISMSTCKDRGITVVGGLGFRETSKRPAIKRTGNGLVSTTEHTWALILGLMRKVVRDDANVKTGGWQGSYATGLADKTLGLLGLGKLGLMTAKIALGAFNMKILAWSANLTQKDADDEAVQAGFKAGDFVVADSKEQLFRDSDIVSVHYVLSDRSRGMIGAAELAAMKTTAYLINTSRGGLIDEQALFKHLKEGKIAGAAFDVYTVEPLEAQSEFRTVKWGQDGRSEVVLSPHMGYVEEETMVPFYEESADNLERWLDGKELNDVLV